MPNLVLFQPDIAQNVGALMRLSACLDLTLHIVEPCGFPWNLRKIQQAGMDYIAHVRYHRHNSWEDFLHHVATQAPGRLLLMTTKGSQDYGTFRYMDTDYLIAGSESTGAPDYVHARADGRVLIPMHGAMRSLNIACASAMIIGEALRQTKPSLSQGASNHDHPPQR